VPRRGEGSQRVEKVVDPNTHFGTPESDEYEQASMAAILL
jgi:hypothetical protein